MMVKLSELFFFHSYRKSSVQVQNRILTKKRMISKAQPRLKISSSLKIKAKKHMSVSTGGKSCLFFSCSWCQFRVSDREHFQRHISLHNFFPQGCKMHCPYCSYTTPSALVLEKHIPTHMDKHPFGCRHCGFSAKTKMMVIRHCKRSHPDIPLKLVNRSTCSQKLKPSWPLVSFSPKVRLKKCAFKAVVVTLAWSWKTNTKTVKHRIDLFIPWQIQMFLNGMFKTLWFLHVVYNVEIVHDLSLFISHHRSFYFYNGIHVSMSIPFAELCDYWLLLIPCAVLLACYDVCLCRFLLSE